MVLGVLMWRKLPRLKRPYLPLPRACLPTWRTNDCPRRRRAPNARCSPDPRWGGFLTHSLRQSAWAIPCWTRTRTRTPSPASYKTRWTQCRTWGVGRFPCTQVVRTPYLTPPRPRTPSWASSTHRTSHQHRPHRQGGLDARPGGFSATPTTSTLTPRTENNVVSTLVEPTSTPPLPLYNKLAPVSRGFSLLLVAVLVLSSVARMPRVKRS